MQDKTITHLDAVCAELEKVAGELRKDTEQVLLLTDPIELVKHFDQARHAQDRIKIARKALEELVDDLSTVQIPTLFTNRSLKTINIEGIGRATVSYRWSCSIVEQPKGGKHAGYTWLREHGHGSLITETVNSSSLAAFAKEMMQADTELPADLFKVSTNPFTSITKA